ncbi:MAG: PaaI family thioesterase [Actinomycetota bacterium]|nr:PaaI family thioesterase [Actinomycetota bacterium]
MTDLLQIPPNCDLTLGIVCVDKSEPGRSVWRVEAHERFANPRGVIQGGFLAACCDSAMGASAVTYAQHRLAQRSSTSGPRSPGSGSGSAGTGTSPRALALPPLRVSNAEMKVSFLRPVQVGSTLTCEAEVVSGGARVAFLEATLKAEDGKVMAKATSTYLFSSPPSGSSPL